MAREYDPDLNDEREEPLLEDGEEPTPPPTIDPDEMIEAKVDEDDAPLDDDRLA